MLLSWNTLTALKYIPRGNICNAQTDSKRKYSFHSCIMRNRINGINDYILLYLSYCLWLLNIYITHLLNHISKFTFKSTNALAGRRHLVMPNNS